MNKTLFFPPFKDKIQKFISTMKIKIFSTSVLELPRFDWSKLTFTWHVHLHVQSVQKTIIHTALGTSLTE